MIRILTILESVLCTNAHWDTRSICLQENDNVLEGSPLCRRTRDVTPDIGQWAFHAVLSQRHRRAAPVYQKLQMHDVANYSHISLVICSLIKLFDRFRLLKT